jgi:hypothetical protein
MFNASDDEWVVMIGRYILNMGSLEFTTRMLIASVVGTDSEPVFDGPLASRISFLRARFPQKDPIRHQWAMKAFDLAQKHTTFRNIVAHSPILITGHEDGSVRIQGIMNVTPKSHDTIAELVLFEELKCRVDESANVAKLFLEMQADFPTKRHD